MTVTKKGKPLKKVKFTENPPLESSWVNLRCQQASSGLVKLVRITNNTDQAVPQGITIRWEANDGEKGSLTLETPLAPGEFIDALKQQAVVGGFSCNAGCFRPPPKITAKRKIKAGG